MKANEAPEKIYLFENPISATPDDRWLSKRSDENDIEYTRTDAFIEKALRWYCRDCECNDNCAANHKCAFRDFFEMYLEGNENALPPKIENALDPEGYTTENYRCRHLISKLQSDFIEKACEWLKKNVTYTHPRKGTEECVVNLNAFIEAMKGE